jgi:F-type H+-transporting ATPase subunit b
VNINATLFFQLVVFVLLGLFTMKLVWPPIMRALDERAKKISDGLAAADKAQSGLALAEKRAVEELRTARESAGEIRASAERNAGQLAEDARGEAARVIEQARQAAEAEADVAAQRAKDELRDQVAMLAIAGAEKILRREINPQVHAELLANLKQELQ